METAAKQFPADLDALAKAGPRVIMALMLWKLRHHNPGMSLTLTPEDVQGLQACLDYQQIEAEVVIMRPQGRPAITEAIPSRPGGPPGISPRPADPPKPFVIVALVEKGTSSPMSAGNNITPIENNEADLARARSAMELADLREAAPRYARQLRAEDAAGICSRDTVTACANALDRLARA